MCAALGLLLAVPLAAQAQILERQWIHGRVEDAGAGAAATVQLVREQSSFESLARHVDGRPEPIALAITTDDDGVFSIETPGPGPWRVRVQAPGALTLEHPIPALPQEIQLPPIALWPAVWEALRVVDVEGNANAHAWVELIEWSLPGLARRQLERGDWSRGGAIGFTSGGGLFGYQRVEGEELRFEVVSEQGREEIAVGPETGQGRVVHRPWQGRRQVEVRLSLADSPAAQALLLVDGWPRRLLGGEPLAAQEAKAVVSVSPSSWVEVITDTGGFGEWHAAPLFTKPEELAAGASAAPAVVELTVQPVEVVKGRVTLAGPTRARPAISDATVQLGAGLVSTDSDGRFSLPLFPGAQRLQVAALGHRTKTVAVDDALVASRAEHGLAVALQPAAIVEGIVIDGRGLPLGGAEVRTETGAAGELWARTRFDGTFRIAGLVPETRYRLVGRLSGRSPAGVTVLTRAAFERRSDVVIVLPDLRDVIGQLVVGPERRPAIGGSIFLSPRSEEERRVEADEQGFFHFEDVPVGEIALSALGPEGRLSHDGEVMEGDGPFDLGQLLLQSTSTLDLRVVDREQRPVEFAEVAVGRVAGGTLLIASPGSDRPFEVQRSVRTAPDGRVRLAGLDPLQPVDITISRRGYVQRTIEGLELPVTEEVLVELATEAVVAGWVLDDDGQPLSEVHVGVASDSGQRLPPRLHQRTDINGHFRIEGLPAGRLKVFANATGRAEIEPVVVLLSEGEEIDELILQEPPHSVVEGRVTWADGRPVVDAAVISAGRFDQTDERGLFRLDHVRRGEQQIEVRTRDSRRMRQRIDVGDSDLYVDLVFDQGFRVSGVVADETGSPLSGVGLALHGSGRLPTVRVRSGSDGSFLIEAIGAGSYRFSSDDSGIALTGGDLQIQVVDADLSDLEVVAESGALVVGFARAPPGTAPHTIRLGLEAVDRPELASPRIQRRLDGDRLVFFAGPLPMGRWVAEAWTPEPASRGRAEFDIGPGRERVEVEVLLEPEQEEDPTVLSLEGLVTIDGRPAERAWVMLSPRFDPRGELPRIVGSPIATTSFSGRFRYEQLTPGSYDLSIAAEGTTLTLLRQLELVRSDVLQLTLERVRVAGRVRDAVTQQLLDEVQVRILPSFPVPPATGGRLRPSGEAGFALEALVEPGARLWVGADGYAPAEVSLSVGMAPLELSLAPLPAPER